MITRYMTFSCFTLSMKGHNEYFLKQVLHDNAAVSLDKAPASCYIASEMRIFTFIIN